LNDSMQNTILCMKNNPETLEIIVNPFFDEVILFLDNMPSSQDKLKPINDDLKLFQLLEKNNVTEFKKGLKSRLRKKVKPSWPYKNDLYIAVAISGHKKDIFEKDLDNLLKTLFDTLKGIVFVDDRQIIKLSAEKIITDRYSGVMLAIKEILPDRSFMHVPFFYTTGKDTWQQEREEKVKEGRKTYFDYY